MRKKMYWGIASLILIIGVVGIFVMLQPEPVPEKRYIVPTEAELKKAREARKPPPGASPNGHWHDDVWHDESHEVPVAQNEREANRQDIIAQMSPDERKAKRQEIIAQMRPRWMRDAPPNSSIRSDEYPEDHEVKAFLKGLSESDKEELHKKQQELLAELKKATADWEAQLISDESWLQIMNKPDPLLDVMGK